MNTSGLPGHSILCGPIAPKKGVSRGGYETANRRTISLLEAAGCHVDAYAYPDTLGKGFLPRAISYFLNFLALRKKLIQRQAKGNAIPFHITPLFKQFILPEFLLIRRAKRLGMRIVLDLRAGNKASDRARFGKTYRKLFDGCIKLADEVSVEGREYIPLIRSIAPDIEVTYLPNFVDGENIAEKPPTRSSEVCRLVYVGTVSEAKGVPDLINVADHLVQIGLPVQLDIIGRPTKSFRKEFERNCKDRPYVMGHGAQSFEYVRTFLDQSHFFVFLTKWPGEGHSNALTEAMARGCVPVATQHGFNQSTISDCGIIIKDRVETVEIASQIAQLWSTPSFDVLAEASINRIRTQFGEDTVRAILRGLYWPDAQT
ncbi:glycosyltransferase family 4 protein [Falsihalocynthiibacter sp. BN13B15]|uniref:glycosyltransferase family 4 protein n=1 Tax=Falsihalocynthiibacter sp. BN13B15 TaxID=3240871 RepID=UPI003510054D